MFKILPYRPGSASAKALSRALGGQLIKLSNSRYRYREGDVVINWGNSHPPSNLGGVPMLNPVDAVALAANKLDAFIRLQREGVQTVPFTDQRTVATEWLHSGSRVFVRNVLNGHSGEGIEVVEPNEIYTELNNIVSRLYELGQDDAADNIEMGALGLPPAPLYTKEVHNHGEYRVHVFGDEVILYQKKSRKVDEEGRVVTADGAEADVRNLASNWVYRTGNLNRLERIENLATQAVAALGLNFGAVDIIKDADRNVAVLEINTAPGLGNTETLLAYTDAFSSLI